MASPALLLILFLFSVLFLQYAAESKKPASPSVKIGGGYRLISVEETVDDGFLGYLHVKQKNNGYGADIPYLRLFVKHETGDRLKVQITDVDKKRWEVPFNLLPREQPPPPLKQAITRSRRNPVTVSEIFSFELVFSYTTDPFGFAVKRKSNGLVLFNSTADGSDSFG